MIIYAPFKPPQDTMNLQQQNQQWSGMYQPDFYAQQPGGSAQQMGPTTADFVAAHLARVKQRPAPPSLQPGARATQVQQSIADPSNFQAYYKQLDTIRDISQQQVAAAQAQAAMARIQASQQLNQISAANPQYKAPSGGGGGNINVGQVPSNPKANFQYAQQLAGQFGWGNERELAAWYTLGMKESGWNNNAQNPTSTAYGIGQFLNSTWAGVGIGKTSDPYTQVLAMAKYIKNRYGSPSAALSFHLSHNWY